MMRKDYDEVASAVIKIIIKSHCNLIFLSCEVAVYT